MSRKDYSGPNGTSEYPRVIVKGKKVLWVAGDEEIPDGYFIVTSGPMKDGDLVLDSQGVLSSLDVS